MTQYNILQSMQCDPFHTKSNSVLIFLSDGIKTLFLLWCGRDRLLLLLFFFFFFPPFCGFFETDWLLLFLEQNWQKAFFSFLLFSRPTGWLCICLLLWVVSLFSCPSSLLSAVFFWFFFVVFFFVPWITVHVGHYLSLQASHFYGKQKVVYFFFIFEYSNYFNFVRLACHGIVCLLWCFHTLTIFFYFFLPDELQYTLATSPQSSHIPTGLPQRFWPAAHLSGTRFT